MEGNVSQSCSRSPNFRWDDELVRLLVKILVEYQKKNGSKQPYNWKEIATIFTSKCGKSVVKDVCRNKYESMKKEYKAWNLLMNSNTGLGWDDNTRTITASNEWWDRKIKENANCKKYRNKGMNVEYEELLRTFFSGNVATGRLAMSSTMVRERTPDRVSLSNEKKICLGDGDGGDCQFFRTVVDTINDEACSYSGVGAILNEQQFESTKAPTPTSTPTPITRVTSDKASMKRKRRQFVGSSKSEGHLAHTREHSEKILALFQEKVNSKEKEEESLMDVGLVILDRLVGKNLVEDGSPLWCFIISKTKAGKDMKILSKLANDEKRVKWLKWEFDNR